MLARGHANDTLRRIVAVYRVLHWHAEGGWTFDADPKERFVYHNAGLAGGGGSSYIDAVVLRDRDANTAWEDEADGTLEERVYYCQNLVEGGCVDVVAGAVSTAPPRPCHPAGGPGVQARGVPRGVRETGSGGAVREGGGGLAVGGGV